jgi:hypothetical protein
VGVWVWVLSIVSSLSCFCRLNIFFFLNLSELVRMGVYIAVCVKRAQAFGCRGMSAAMVACCYTIKEVITAFFGVSVCSFCVP